VDTERTTLERVSELVQNLIKDNERESPCSAAAGHAARRSPSPARSTPTRTPSAGSAASASQNTSTPSSHPTPASPAMTSAPSSSSSASFALPAPIQHSHPHPHLHNSHHSNSHSSKCSGVDRDTLKQRLSEALGLLHRAKLPFTAHLGSQTLMIEYAANG
jgi:hypothetical protein